MYRCLIILVLFLEMCLVSFTSLQAQAKDPLPANLTATGIVATDKIIDIAVSGEEETNPAVALCASNQYLTVYERGGEIYGQRLTGEGELLGDAFVISEGNQRASEPDVACDWGRDRFIVVWTYDYDGDGIDYDIRGQGVYGEYQTSDIQLQSNLFYVATMGLSIKEQNPTIACNSDDHTCLIVYKRREGTNDDIYARRVSVNEADNTISESEIPISGGTESEIDPDVAWGGANDNYLVVWSAWYTPSITGYYRVAFCHVYDTYQTGDQLQHNRIWLIDPNLLDYAQTMPVVAYNRNTGQYLVSFQFDYQGEHNIYAQRVYGTGPSTIGDVFSVAASDSDETNPIIAFSGGPEDIPGAAANQFLISYYKHLITSTMIYAQGIKGAYDPNGYQLDGSARVVATSGIPTSPFLLSPDVTGSVDNARYLTVWGGGDILDSNILGRLITSYRLYLPLIFRN